MNHFALRVMTANIHKGFSSFNRRFVLHELREALVSIEADVMFLQEVQGAHLRNQLRHRERWPDQPQHEFLGGTLHHAAYGRNAVYRDGHHGNALLSRLPISCWRNLDVSLTALERRGLLHCEIAIGAGPPLHCVCVHLSLREEHRQLQLDQLQMLVESIPPNAPIVIAGDFNDWRHRAQRRMQQLGFDEAHTFSHGRPAVTFPAWRPTLSLDRIYVRGATSSTGVKLENRKWAMLSDHLPVLAEIRFGVSKT